LPEAKEVTEDPGKLPQPDKVTKAYFEVSFSSKRLAENSNVPPPQGRLAATI